MELKDWMRFFQVTGYRNVPAHTETFAYFHIFQRLEYVSVEYLVSCFGIFRRPDVGEEAQKIARAEAGATIRCGTLIIVSLPARFCMRF